MRHLWAPASDGSFLRPIGSFTLRCPTCVPNYRSESGANMAQIVAPDLFRGITGFKPALSRLMSHGYDYTRRALLDRKAPCFNCGRSMPLRLDPPVYKSGSWSVFGTRGVYVRCEICQSSSDLCLKGIALWQPEGRQFWTEHRKIQALPELELDAGGRAAIMTRFESVSGDANFDVLLARDTYQVLSVHVASARSSIATTRTKRDM